MSLTLHESNPGHHLQETFAKYSDTPNFLKVTYEFTMLGQLLPSLLILVIFSSVSVYIYVDTVFDP